MLQFRKKQRFLAEYNDNYAKIYRYIRLRVSSEEEAKDLVSEVFLAAFEHLNDYAADKGTFIQWLFGIAKRTLINAWRKKKYTTQEIEEYASPTAQKQIEQAAEVELVLEKLSERERYIVASHYLDDQTYEAIAADMGMSAAAVRKCASRAIKKCQELAIYETLSSEH